MRSKIYDFKIAFEVEIATICVSRLEAFVRTISFKMKIFSIVNKYPSLRENKSCWGWLNARRLDDNAEGLWRIHDRLYDLSSFINKHPGGKDWLEMTKVRYCFINSAIDGYNLSLYYFRERTLLKHLKLITLLQKQVYFFHHFMSVMQVCQETTSSLIKMMDFIKH